MRKCNRSRDSTNAVSARRGRRRSRREGEGNVTAEKEAKCILGQKARRSKRRNKERPRTRRKGGSTTLVNL